ncbi:MAG: polysaccharide biosynthesis tyrosine autokinase [Acidobacteria bacterium]|nr:polysaccharide biosynthesis tyrosine autokinase [Acidobacteriota bacterium]MBS1865491.1 polysaccharide biosynthesis tyrosine autokinase [Acidobacteriota bacterium]
MSEDNKIVPKDNGSNGAVELLGAGTRFGTFDLSPREPHLYDYLLILRKHQWLILSFLLAVVTIVSIATFRMQPVYSTTARIEIDRENSNVLPFQGADSYDFMLDMDNYIETQSKILTSETLALQTIRSTGLAGRPEYSSGESPSEAIASGNLANHKRPPELAAFLGSLSVRRVPNSRLLDVTFESTDPQLAARIVNAHVENFKEANFRSRYEAIARASSWLTDQLDDMKVKVQKSEDARIEYERKNQIWELDDKQNTTTQRLSDLNKELTDAQSERMKKQALYEFAKSADASAVPELRGDVALQDLIKKKADVNAQYTDALAQYGPNFPKVLRLQGQTKEIDQLIDGEKKAIIEQMGSDYNASRQREMLLTQALEEQKAAANQMAERLVEYNILKREAEANKTLYDGMLTKLREANISSTLKSSNIFVVDPAMVPSTPTRPAKARNIVLAFIVGLVGGIGLALLREYLDNTVKTPDDIETLSRLPSLAVVPAFSDSNGNGRRRRLIGGISANGHDKKIELVAQHLPKSQMSEAFRALRTALLLSQPDHPPQVVLVTSALPREGKTTAAANLAVTLAQLGDRTLLIDCDLRKPGVGRLLNMTDGKYAGFSSYLAGVSSLELVTVPHPTIPNLAVIPTGPLPPNPADLLSSHKLADAVVELRKRFKFIVIDSPPIMAATDAVILSVQTDGVLLVVRSGETPKEAFTRTRDLLISVKCRMLGVVLNAVDSSAPDYYYSYRYYPYSYGYGPQENADLSHVTDEDLPRIRKSKNSDDDELAL